MSELPNGWAMAQIGELCELINGKAFKPTDWTDSGLPIVRIQNLNNPNATFNYYAGEVPEKFHIDSGELLFAWSGTPGTSFGAHVWNRGRAVLNQHIFRVLFDDRIVRRNYFQIAINHKLDELIGKAHGGVGLRHVTKGKFEETEVLIPPLPEQDRILLKIESLFSHLDRCGEELDRVSVLIEQYKEAALEKAFNGNTLHPNEVRPTSGDWPKVPLSDLLEEGPTNGYSPRASVDATGTLSLKLTATTRGIMDLSDKATKRLSETIDPQSKYWLRNGDILVQRANSIEYVGATAIFNGPESTYIYPDLMMRLRVSSSLLANYLWRYLNYGKTRKYFQDNATGTAGNMPKINGKVLRALPVPLPPHHDMERIVEFIEDAFARADAMLAEAQKAQDQLQRLRASILKRAFAGHLVPQYPDDEPASVLLEKIRAERVAQTPARRRSKAGRKPQEKSTKKGAKDMNDKKRSDVGEYHLSDLIKTLGGRVQAKELWLKSEMELNEFYKLLRDEVSAGRISEAANKETLVLGNAA